MSTYTQTVQDGWVSYLQKVIPVDAGKIQKVESKRAFYAGAFYMLMTFKNMPDDMTEDEGVAWLQARQDEIQGFYTRVEQGQE